MPPRTGTLARLVDSPRFNNAVLVVILANAVVLGLETYDGVQERWGDALDTLDLAFFSFFCAELVLRIASYWPRPLDFFRSGWNVFDFLVVGLALVPAVRENAMLLRIVRLLRVVRVIRVLPDLRVLLGAVRRSIPPLVTMTVLTTLLIFLYGMVGWVLFHEELPDDWGTIGDAMLTLFVMLTLENFPTYMDAGMEVRPWSWVYFVSFVLVAVFLVLNVLIGIVLNSMERAREEELRRVLGEGRDDGVGLTADVPVVERIQMLRAALDELEQELVMQAERDTAQRR